MEGPRSVRIGSREDLEAYLDGDDLECLECGRRFRQLVPHLRAAHRMTPAEYRQAHDMPAETPLAGRGIREGRSVRLRRLIAEGIITYDHLPRAVQMAREVTRGERASWERAERAAQLRALPRAMAPQGTRNQWGHDVERTREYTRARRAAAKGDCQPMNAYRLKWRKSRSGLVPK